MPQPLRNDGLSIGAGFIAALLTVVALIVAVASLAVSSGRVDGSDVDPAVSGAVFAAFTVFGLIVTVRTFRVGVIAESGAVVVRTVTSTERLPAGEFAGLCAQPILRGRAWRPAVVTTDGRVLGTAWSSVRHPGPAWAERLVRFERAVQRPPDAPTAGDVLTAGDRARPTPEGLATVTWAAPPGWAVPPAGWVPPPYWQPPVGWPAPPADWQWWRYQPIATADAPQVLGRGTAPALADPAARRTLKLETVVVMVAFLLPAVAGAVGELLEALVGQQQLDNFALPVTGHVTVSFLILIISYVPIAASVPVALLLLARTGQGPRHLGLTWQGVVRAVFPAVGLAVIAYLAVIVVSLVFHPLFDSGAANNAHETHVPAYFVVYAIILSATTAVTEEVFVNAYLLTRLAQLGWRPWPAFALSLALRTSYHLYYGVAIIATVPFGWFVTRSFQRNGKLARPILAHFLYDASQLIAAVVTS